MIEITEYTPETFWKLKEKWHLLEQGKEMTAFQKYHWYQNLNELYKKERVKKVCGRKWVYLLAEENGIPVMIAPFQICMHGFGYQQYGVRRGCYFIGRMGYTDYLNFIYSDFSEEACGALLNYVVEKYHQKTFIFEQIPEQTSAHQYVVKIYHPSIRAISCAALFLPKTFEEYKKLLSKSRRQNIRTALNRARKDQVELTHYMYLDENIELKKSIKQLGEEGKKRKNQSSRQQMTLPGYIYSSCSSIIRKFFAAKQDVLFEAKETFCFCVKHGERMVGFYWGVRNDVVGEWYVILAGFDENYARYTPCISHLYLYLQESYEKASCPFRILDFTRGGEAYKKSVGCTEKKVNTLTFSI